MDGHDFYRAALVILDSDMRVNLDGMAATGVQEALPPTQHVLPTIFPLVGERWLIGRDDTCQIRVRAGRADISRRHATITREGRRFLIEDHSSFGTLINGQPLVAPWALAPGDVIGLASTHEMMRFDDLDSQWTPPSLTDRELTVLRHLAAGKLNKEIAADLFISPTTVNTYLKRIYEKLNAHSRTEAVSNARYHRII